MPHYTRRDPDLPGEQPFIVRAWHITDPLDLDLVSLIVRESRGLVAAYYQAMLPEAPGAPSRITIAYLTVNNPLCGPDRADVGDWIVQDPDRAMRVMPDVDFQALYDVERRALEP